jgi:predicted nucleic acid-binding Zn ribbon protein
MSYYSWHAKRACSICGTEFQASRSDAQFCSANCRKVASRQKQQLEKTYQRANQAIRDLEEYIKSGHRLKQDALKLLSKLDKDTAAINAEHGGQRHIYSSSSQPVPDRHVTH